MANSVDLSNIFISDHALERFQERWRGVPPKNYEKTLRRILRSTEEIWKKPLSHIKALIKYKKPARYFRASDWVFVVVIKDDMASLDTAERYSDHPTMWDDKQKKSRKRKRIKHRR